MSVPTLKVYPGVPAKKGGGLGLGGGEGSEGGGAGGVGGDGGGNASKVP